MWFSGIVRRCTGRELVFFFQAEDGIRDLVRSRGLGDVYKRQLRDQTHEHDQPDQRHDVDRVAGQREGAGHADDRPVSYTHLTLPTSDLV